MPVVFAPPDPFSSKILSEYGATQEFDKTLPTMAGLAESQNRLRQQGAQAAIQQATQAQIATQQNRERAYETDVRTEQGYEEQRRSQQQQLEVQARSQAFQAAMQDRQLTYADEIKQRDRQNALTAINEAVTNGTLSPEEAGVRALQIRTGINEYDQQMKKQHAADFAAQAELRQNEAKTQALNLETIRGLQMKAAQGQMSTGVLINPITGVPHWARVDDKGNIVPIETGKHAEEQQAQGEWAHLAMKGTNKLDVQKAMKDAESWAKFNVDPVYTEQTDASGKTKMVLDKPATDQAIKARAQARLDGIRREFNAANPGQAAPGQQAQPNTPGQQAQAENDQRGTPDVVQSTVQKIDSNPRLGVVEKESAKNAAEFLAVLLKKPNHTPQELAQIEQYLKHIEAATR
jgi:actin-related protein